MSALSLFHLGGSSPEKFHYYERSGGFQQRCYRMRPAFRRVSPLPQAAEDLQGGRRICSRFLVGAIGEAFSDALSRG